jgi:GDP-L-fucose synthase
VNRLGMMQDINKNVLVTGANGMVAYQLIRLLRDRNCNLTLTDLHEKSKFFSDEKYISGDLRSRSFTQSICKNQDIVFSLVGLKASPEECLKKPASHSVTMNQFNSNIIESAFKNDVEWFLYTSSVGVYYPSEVLVEDDVWKTTPSHNDWYGGWAKRMGELNVEASMIEYSRSNCSIVRPANIYGKWDVFSEKATVIGSLISKAYHSNNDILEVWGDGTPIRDFIYSEDVARGMIHMVENEVTQPVNLGSGTGVTIKEVAETIAEYFEQEIDYDITKPMGDMKRLMSTKRAESYGFKPEVNLKEGIIRTIKWYEENINELQ